MEDNSPEKQEPLPDESYPEERPDASTETTSGQPASGQVSSTSPGDFPAAAEKTESRLAGIIRLALRWLAIFMVIFALGFLTAYLTLYRPQANDLGQTQTSLEQANQKNVTLQNSIDTLTPLQAKNQDLQNQLNQDNVHIALLTIARDVMTARVALAQNDAAAVRLSLSKTGDRIKTLQGLLTSDQQQSAGDMQQRLKLVLDELDSNKHAAQSDLEVLSTDLLQMENTLFTAP